MAKGKVNVKRGGNTKTVSSTMVYHYSKKIITNMSKEDLQIYFHSSIICNFKKTNELKCSAVKNYLIKYSTPNDATL